MGASAFHPENYYLTSYTETDPTIYPWAKATTKPTYTYSEVTSKPTFATVATTGLYADLTGKPTIPTYSVFNSVTNGLTPLSGGGTANYLRADGTWATPPSGSTYVLPLAASGTRGGIELGYTPQNNTLAVGVNLGKAYVGLTAPAIQFALTGAVNTVGGQSIFGSGDIPFVVPDGSVSRSKLSVYNGGSSGNVLTYDATYGLTWTTPSSGADGNNYPTSLSFNYMTGDLTIVRNGLSNLVYSLNGRYAYLGGASTQSFYVSNLYANGSISGVTTLSASGIITGSNFQLSDRRLKQNIKPITFSNVNQIKFYQFDMIADSSHRTRYGSIAQDVEKIMPELVYTDEKGMKAVNYIDLLIAKIAELESRITSLEDDAISTNPISTTTTGVTNSRANSCSNCSNGDTHAIHLNDECYQIKCDQCSYKVVEKYMKDEKKYDTSFKKADDSFKTDCHEK